MTAAEAIKNAREGQTGVVTVDEPIVILGGRFKRQTLSPGQIDLATLAKFLADGDSARAWEPKDAE